MELGKLASALHELQSGVAAASAAVLAAGGAVEGMAATVCELSQAPRVVLPRGLTGNVAASEGSAMRAVLLQRSHWLEWREVCIGDMVDGPRINPRKGWFARNVVRFVANFESGEVRVRNLQRLQDESIFPSSWRCATQTQREAASRSQHVVGTWLENKSLTQTSPCLSPVSFPMSDFAWAMSASQPALKMSRPIRANAEARSQAVCSADGCTVSSR